MNIREAAVRTLYEIDVNNAYSNAAMKKILAENSFEKRDKALFSEIVCGTLKNKIKIDYVISTFSRVKPKKISPWVLNILRTGAYQILFLDRVPDSAACNEAARLAGKYSNRGSVGFVNGMLRSISRNKSSISYPVRENGALKFLSVEYSYPEWLAEKLIKQYGEEKAERFMCESNKAHKTYIRVNALKTNTEELKRIFENMGIAAEATSLSENMLKASPGIDLTLTDEYKNGLFSIQNVSSKLAADILNPSEGDLVIDMCAAPGGKSCAMAEKMRNKGTVYAFDIYPHKIELIKKSAERTGLGIIKAEVSDALNLRDDLVGRADKVLADVPCSGIGTIHKKPDIKFTRKKEDIEELSRVQKKILQNASEYLKDGGELLYSTCTVFKEENEENVNWFLSNNTSFEKLYEKQILTSSDGETGFYICKMRKNAK